MHPDGIRYLSQVVQSTSAIDIEDARLVGDNALMPAQYLQRERERKKESQGEREEEDNMMQYMYIACDFERKTFHVHELLCDDADESSGQGSIGCPTKCLEDIPYPLEVS